MKQPKLVVEERLPQGSQEAPMLVITANKAEDLEELGPAAVTYISQLEGLPPDQWAKAWVAAAKEQGQQAQEGAEPVQGLVKQEVQAAQEEKEKDQEVQGEGHKGGKTKGHNWFDLTEQEGRERQQEESPMVTAAKSAARAAAKEAASTAALASIAAFAQAKAKAQEREEVTQEGRAGSSQDHRVQQDRKEAEGQQGQEEAEGSRVSKAKELQAGLLARLTQWWGGCQ